MKKATLTVTFDGAKLDALKIYLEQRGASIEDEVSKHLETLYAKNVPAGVREFIDMRSVSVPRRKPVREHGSKAECDENE